MAQAEMKVSAADAESLGEKLSNLNLSEGEAQVLAAAMGGELAPKSDVEPYISVKVLGRTVATVRIRTPFGTITSARRPS